MSDRTFASDVNKLGDQGWELVYARRASSTDDPNQKSEFSYEMIFKRPK